MRVALPLLTLVPGISGGSETYARELCRALARVGAPRVPGARPDDRDGRRRRARAVVATGYRASTTTPGRLAAMATRRRAARRACASASRAPTSSTTRSPSRCRPLAARRCSPCSTSSTSTCRSSSRAASGSSARLAYDRAARARRPGDRDQRLGPRAAWSTGSASTPTASTPIHLGVDHDALHARSPTSREPFLSTRRGRGRTRTTPGCSRLRAACAATARAAARAHRRRPRRPASCRRCRDARRRPARDARRRSTAAPRRSSSRASTRASACRRSRRWPAAARSRVSTAGSLPEVVGDAARALRPDDPDAIAAGVERGARASRTSSARAGSPARARFTWEATARAHDRVYELALAS